MYFPVRMQEPYMYLRWYMSVFMIGQCSVLNFFKLSTLNVVGFGFVTLEYFKA